MKDLLIVYNFSNVFCKFSEKYKIKDRDFIKTLLKKHLLFLSIMNMRGSLIFPIFTSKKLYQTKSKRLPENTLDFND